MGNAQVWKFDISVLFSLVTVVVNRCNRNPGSLRSRAHKSGDLDGRRSCRRGPITGSFKVWCTRLRAMIYTRVSGVVCSYSLFFIQQLIMVQPWYIAMEAGMWSFHIWMPGQSSRSRRHPSRKRPHSNHNTNILYIHQGTSAQEMLMMALTSGLAGLSIVPTVFT